MKSIILLAILFAVSMAAPILGPGPTTNYVPRNRTYYIAAVEIDWNYAPSGEDLVWPPGYGFFNESRQRLVFRKAVYREYMDATFTTPKPRSENETYLGLLGPIIRGVVGDTIKIFFMNKASFPFSIAAHGVTVDKSHEGALYDDGTNGTAKFDDMVLPGQMFNYTWLVTPDNGPSEGDVSTVVFPYHSIVRERNDINSGLFGSTIITRPDWADPVTAKPLDVDREFVVLFNIFDETLSLYTSMNNISPNSTEEFLQKYSLNGYIFGNLRNLTVHVNETVRWYVIAAGDDFHSPDWHGNPLIFDNRRVAAVPLTPGVSLPLTMKAAVPGTWLFYCHVEDHSAEGMATTYTVL